MSSGFAQSSTVAEILPGSAVECPDDNCGHQTFPGLSGMNGATGMSDKEGKVTRVGASEPGGERVSMERLG